MIGPAAWARPMRMQSRNGWAKTCLRRRCLVPQLRPTSTTATFTWAAVTNAISYRVVLTDNTTGGSVSLSTGSATSLLSTSATGLISGHSYTFSVWSQFPNLANPGGGTNLESSPVVLPRTFTVLTSLAAPTLSWPVNIA